ncbi:acyl-CoA dehydrogenase family protein [Nocardioides litoris]|uniref:acyl-CoA dehydrogenase family protein n=1 Tax=Nocardioides litoris TaxID=1926648 RepID=UPI001B85B597|nr:acyl-CoA dehydrogenase family protein [Nocardioides litoris]
MTTSTGGAPVLLDPGSPADERLAGVCDDVRGLVATGTDGRRTVDVAAALGWAVDLGTWLPDPAGGATRLRWEVLATVGAHDLTVARAVEPHLDAVAILGELGADDARIAAGPTWGVYAAEGPPPRLEATRAESAGAGWSLTGRKPWCSLATVASHALVTAWVEPARRGLFEIDLRDRGVTVEDAVWAPHGLREITSTAVLLDDVPARPVGGPGWYLDRPGFAWGGIGVAAVWYGGAVGLARRLRQAAERRAPDQVALAHLGAVDTALAGARAVLREAAEVADRGGPAADRGGTALLAARVRNVVAGAAETVLTEVGHALGPGPLSQEPEHADRVADLVLYLRQHHARRDHAAAGGLLLDQPDGPLPW